MKKQVLININQTIQSDQPQELKNYFNPQQTNFNTISSNSPNFGSIEPDYSSQQQILSKNLVQLHLTTVDKKNLKEEIKQVCQWQAVYIEGKFYLSDHATINRYYQIQELLKKQQNIQQDLTKMQKNEFIINKNKKQQFKKQEKLSIKDIENRLYSLQTINIKEQDQSEQQKIQNQSLLNNLHTSSQDHSIFTLKIHHSNFESNMHQQTQRIDSISSIAKDQQISIKKDSSKDFNKSKHEKAIVHQSRQNINDLKIKQPTKDCLSSNNNKVQYTNNKNQYHQNLQNLSKSLEDRQDGSDPSLHNSVDQKPSNYLKENLSLQEQKKTVLPTINHEAIIFKASSLLQQVFSNDIYPKSNQLPQVTEQKQEDLQLLTDEISNLIEVKSKNSSIKSQKISSVEKFQESQEMKSFLQNQSIQKEQSVADQSFSQSLERKKYSSLPADLQKLLIYKQIQGLKLRELKPSKTQQNLNDNKNKQQLRDLSILSNHKNIDIIQSNQQNNSIFDSKLQSNPIKKFQTQQIFSKLSSISQKKPLANSYKKNIPYHQFYKLKLNLDSAKKYSLPSISCHSEKKCMQHSKNSLDQQFQSSQKLNQNKMIQKASQIAQSAILSKKSRINGYIRKIQLSNIHSSAFQFQNTQSKIIESQKNSHQEESKSKSKGIKDMKSRSSFVIRNYQNKVKTAQSKQDPSIMSHRNEETEIEFQVKKNKVKFEEDIGKIKFFNEAKENKQKLLLKLQRLQKKQFKVENNEIKKSIRSIQFQKLNKISKTIDLESYEENNLQQKMKQTYKQHLDKILSHIPQQVKNITKPADIAKFSIPKQILQSNSQIKIQPQMNPEQLQFAAIKVYKLFGIDYDPHYRPISLLAFLQKPELSLKQKQKLLIKKFKNCVIFDLVTNSSDIIKNKTILWNFSNKQSHSNQLDIKRPAISFYIGGWNTKIQTNQSSIKKQKQFIKGSKDGFGIQINQRFIYEGQYLNGKKHGYGKLSIIQSGYKYEGQFIQNHKFGYGMQFNPFKEQIYVGQFRYDKKHGKGCIKKLSLKNKENKNNKSENYSFPYFFDGNFLNDYKQNGHQFFQNGDQYKGEYLNNKLHGNGVFKWINGAEYDGKFYKNMKHGFGKWSSGITGQGSSSQALYIGQFKKNKKDGEGKYIYKSGEYYQGNFQNDLKHGAGSLFYQGENGDQKVLRGYWKQGNIVANSKGEIYKVKLEKQEDFTPLI